jgi:GNAT superfamily N-acetyltransferase
MHGQPLGRIAVAEKLGLSKALAQWSRNETISNLRVAWLSRIAVAPPFQRLGIGTQLALKVRRMTRQRRIPKADFLEVIRSFPASHRKQKDCGQDFLERAGFFRVKNPMQSKQCHFPLPNSRKTMLRTAVKFYYYADLRDDD